jgi:hypothetical protein
MPSILQGGPRHGSSAAPNMHNPEHDKNTGETGDRIIHDHGDGTYHSTDGEGGDHTEHPHIGHLLMHIAAKHSDGMHHHTHNDGMSEEHTSHQVAHGGEVEGPHDHENLESVKHGMDQFFNEEAQESAHHDRMGGSESASGDY